MVEQITDGLDSKGFQLGGALGSDTAEKLDRRVNRAQTRAHAGRSIGALRSLVGIHAALYGKSGVS
jgi:hypothetical protein